MATWTYARVAVPGREGLPPRQQEFAVLRDGEVVGTISFSERQKKRGRPAWRVHYTAPDSASAIVLGSTVVNWCGSKSGALDRMRELGEIAAAPVAKISLTAAPAPCYEKTSDVKDNSVNWTVARVAKPGTENLSERQQEYVVKRNGERVGMVAFKYRPKNAGGPAWCATYEAKDTVQTSVPGCVGFSYWHSTKDAALAWIKTTGTKALETVRG